MTNAINVMLLYGGKSGEHEISLISAASVLTTLDKDKYNVIPIGIDKEGCYHLNTVEDLLNYPTALPVVTPLSQPLSSLVCDGRLVMEADVVFPVVHGPLYEDGCLQGMLELAGVAYVGCDVLSSAIGMDKDIARRLACVDGIKAARYRSWSGGKTAQLEQFCKETVAQLGWPLFVKPCAMGSSVGIHKVKNRQELESAIVDALRYDKVALVEECIIGREIELAVLENEVYASAPKVSVPGEIRVHHRDGFYSYSAKYLDSGTTELIIPAQLDAALVHRLQQMAADIFLRLKCKGMARIDFFVDEKQSEIYFNEINTIPGFTSISMYPKLWQASGLSYMMLLDKLVELALTHYRYRQQLVTHYQ